MLTIKEIGISDRGLISDILAKNWGSSIIVTRGKVHDASALPGFIAEEDGEAAGLLTYHMKGFECEIVSLDSLVEKRGVGSSLIEAVVNAARERECHRIWLITTNDNTNAMRFYQKRGFSFSGLYLDAVTDARAIKPQIPTLGCDGIPIRHEIEFEMKLNRTFDC